MCSVTGGVLLKRHDLCARVRRLNTPLIRVEYKHAAYAFKILHGVHRLCVRNMATFSVSESYSIFRLGYCVCVD